MLLYKQKLTTRKDEWNRILSSSDTFLYYKYVCSSSSSPQKDNFESISKCIKLCNFTAILTPGSSHVDRIDPFTKRKQNICFRTYVLSFSLFILLHKHKRAHKQILDSSLNRYRRQARCVFEMFCSFLTTKGGEKARPSLLIRCGSATPNWISPLECQKLAVGTSLFRCCESNHTTVELCQRSFVRNHLNHLIKTRASSLFSCGKFAEARWTICFTNYWCRDLVDNEDKSWNSLQHFNEELHWSSTRDETWKDREGFPFLGYAATSDCIHIVVEAIKKLTDTHKSSKDAVINMRTPKKGLVELGICGFMSYVNFKISLSLFKTHLHQ